MFATLWFCMDFKIMYEAACISRAAYLFFWRERAILMVSRSSDDHTGRNASAIPK